MMTKRVAMHPRDLPIELVDALDDVLDSLKEVQAAPMVKVK